MKTLAIVALAITGFTITPTASAHDHGIKFNKQKNFHNHHHNHSFHCAPTYVCTKEICRTTQCHYGYDHCGHKYVYHVTVVTYANYFSDGSYTTFKKTYRA